MKIPSSTLCFVLLSAPFIAVAPAQTNSCESLASLALPGATITMAQSVPAGELSSAGRGGRGGRGAAPLHVPAFCRVAATLKPSIDSEIKMEIWLPASGWNGNFEGNGNTGWTGSIAPATLAAGLERGYAAAMSDLGHEGGSASFALGHPEKLIDFGYRAAHEMTLTSKAIIGKFYGREPKYSYWNGCSAGGRSALMEAQRYPADFDGIVAGSPGLNWTGRAIDSVWIAQATHKDGSFIPAAKFALIHDAVLQACDAHDGVKDGVLEDPTHCNFDPKELECKDADGPGCLTKAQIETARAIYAPYPNQTNQQAIFPGFEPGSELGWNIMAGSSPLGLGIDLFKYIVFQDPNWDYKTFDFGTDVARTEKADAGTMNALSPDLKAFAARGGKMIQYHGWADPQIAPGSSVNYYGSVRELMGGSRQVESFYRLFMVPGMAHCEGGDGTSTFDALTALEGWVEKDHAPDQIPASLVREGRVDRTRPLCPYPQVARYKGAGNTDDAVNFVCKAP